jgi:tetraprenyl-beta-curcumene synthase
MSATHIAHGVRERIALTATFTNAALRYWLRIHPCVRRERRRLRRRASEIPDPTLCRLALEAFAKRANIEGAAAFATFTPRRHRNATICALVAFQAIYDHVDVLAEHPNGDPEANARSLHGALLVALDPAAEHLDYLEHYPQRDDGGYLDAIIQTCHTALRTLPSYPSTAAAAARAAARIVAFQSLNVAAQHGEPHALRQWASAQTPPRSGLSWWETAAAAGSSLSVHALIAAAADPALDPRKVAALESAYFPWIGALHSLLDSLVDQAEDAETGELSLLGCYATPEDAAARMAEIAGRAAHGARQLPAGRRHLVILAGMAGSYLHNAPYPPAGTPSTPMIARAVMRATGGLVRPALLVFSARDSVVCLLRYLPGLCRADDIKKGVAQVMLFDRLKPGCHCSLVFRSVCWFISRQADEAARQGRMRCSG